LSNDCKAYGERGCLGIDIDETNERIAHADHVIELAAFRCSA
jgi:hypothetical protein